MLINHHKREKRLKGRICDSLNMITMFCIGLVCKIRETSEQKI